MPTGQNPNEPYEPGSYTYGLDYDSPDDDTAWIGPPEPEPAYDPVDDTVGDSAEEIYEQAVRDGHIDPRTTDKPWRHR